MISLSDNSSDVVNTLTSDSPESQESRNSESLSDHVFSTACSSCPSSSRSSSPTRMSETNDKMNIDPPDHYRPTGSEQSIYLSDLTIVPRKPQQDWPTSISSIDQPAMTVGYCNVGIETSRVPPTTINGNHSYCNSPNATKPQSDEENIDRSSFTISNSGSEPDASSTDEPDGQSTEGDESTNSKTSSNESDSSSKRGTTKANHGDKLEAFIKEDVLRTDPAVAELFYQNIIGKLEYSSPEYSGPVDEINELSLLDLLEFEAFNLVGHSGAPTECPGSSSGPSSSSSGTQRRESTSNLEQINPSLSSGSGGSNPTRNDSISQDDPNQLVKSTVRSNSSQGSKVRPLRCIHNAIAPGTFSVNEVTLEKFRPCSGPGWNSIQHLKEHMQNVHTKQVKKVNPLQCSRCQDEFRDQDELKSHQLNIDCAIRCPDCVHVFPSKAQRQEHQKENHLEDENDPLLRELDDSIWKQIKDNLNVYTTSLKNKKGGPSGIPNPERERWVLENIPRYENGRSSKLKANSKLELGQWYTIFTTLAPNMKILEHPFYDYGTPRSDYAQERILFIHDKIIDARVEAHGFPSADFDLQREWYREALRDSLRVAAKTKQVSHSKSAASRQNNTVAPSPASGPGPSIIGGTGYKDSMAATVQMPHPSTMDSMSGTSAPPHPYPLTQQYTIQDQWSMPLSDVPGPMTIDPAAIYSQYTESPAPMTDSNGPQFQSSHYLGQGNLGTQDDFSDLASWPGQQGGY
ncbi:hypothetical protein BGZ57DRAFT_876173 [Hyaloscypha finlandica]|nr:hypothetical protein BGZ57DRAFT_876173 [Hyaloscypha finlandica]